MNRKTKTQYKGNDCSKKREEEDQETSQTLPPVAGIALTRPLTHKQAIQDKECSLEKTRSLALSETKIITGNYKILYD